MYKSQLSSHVNQRNHGALQSRVKTQVSILFHIDSTVRSHVAFFDFDLFLLIFDFLCVRDGKKRKI